MYLYFDRYGTLKEQITFNPARVGNSNVNKIFVYWEGVEEFPDWAQELALQTRYLLQDNTQYPSATTFGFSAQPETAELPFDKNQDLKYFKYYKEYKFLTIDIPDEVLSYNGAVKSYIWVLNADKKRILGLGVFAFMVDGDINEVIPDENISLAQWNMISAQLGLLSGSVIDVTCDIATNTLKVYYANGLTAIRNLPPNGAQTTISSNFLQEMIFSADTWVQDGENGYYTYFYSMGVGYTDNRFFVQLERDGNYESDYYNKTGSFVLSDNIFKGSDGSVLLYSHEPYSGRLLVVGGDLLSGDILVTGLTYKDVNSQLSYKTADGITHTIYLGINEKFDKSNITQTTGDSGLKVMSQKVVTELLNDKLFKWDVVQTTGDSTVKVMSQKAATDNFARLVDGKVPASQLPSYVDDVLEYDSKNDFPEPGETGKIYVDKSTNLTYRWSGSTYIIVGGGDLNIENGTGTGSLVQKTVSSSGTPYANYATGSGAIALGKETKALGNTAFVFGQGNIDGASGSIIGGYHNENGIRRDGIAIVIDQGGNYGIMSGMGNKNNTDRNIIAGAYNIISKNTTQGADNNGDNIICGTNNIISSTNSLVSGSNNTISSQFGAVIGRDNNQGSNYGVLVGSGLVNTGNYKSAFGRYNENRSGSIFEIGIGLGDQFRKNVFTVIDTSTTSSMHGYIEILESGTTDKSLVTKKYIDDKDALNSNIVNGTGYGSLKNRGTSLSPGYMSSAFGELTYADHANQFVVGVANNYSSASAKKALFIVGKGSTDTNRSNAFEVLRDGRAKIYGEPTESDDVVRLNEFSVLTQEQVDLLF